MIGDLIGDFWNTLRGPGQYHEWDSELVRKHREREEVCARLKIEAAQQEEFAERRKMEERLLYVLQQPAARSAILELIREANAR